MSVRCVYYVGYEYVYACCVANVMYVRCVWYVGYVGYECLYVVYVSMLLMYVS